MNLDGDDDLVGFGHFDDLFVAAFHQVHGVLVIFKAFRLVQPVGGGDARATDQVGPLDRLEHVGHAARRPFQAREREGCVDLGEGDAVASIFCRSRTGSS